jgi:hypothetical protein
MSSHLALVSLNNTPSASRQISNPAPLRGFEGRSDFPSPLPPNACCSPPASHPKVVQEPLGHSQIGIALDVYSHVLPSMQVEAAVQLNGLMQPVKAKLKAK